MTHLKGYNWTSDINKVIGAKSAQFAEGKSWWKHYFPGGYCFWIYKAISVFYDATVCSLNICIKKMLNRDSTICINKLLLTRIIRCLIKSMQESKYLGGNRVQWNNEVSTYTEWNFVSTIFVEVNSAPVYIIAFTYGL